MIKFKLNWRAVAIILLALLAVWFGLRWYNRDVVTVKAAAVSRGDIEEVISASGTVDAPVYELGTKMGGRVVNLNVTEGDWVSKGETLMEFDDTSRLVAPNSGVVAKINYREGETVVPGAQPAVIVANLNQSWVEAQIDEIDIGHVKLGDEVKISSDVYPDQVFPGKIYWIAPIAELRRVGGRVKMDEESYVFPCKIKFLDGHKELKVNMSVNVDISTRRSANTLTVPREAILSKDDASFVFKLVKGRVMESKIEIGLRSFASLEAVSGVAEGDLLAVSNLNKLKNKGRIKIEK